MGVNLKFARCRGVFVRKDSEGVEATCQKGQVDGLCAASRMDFPLLFPDLLTCKVIEEELIITCQ